jgi:uncharacterized membrane protein YfcA
VNDTLFLIIGALLGGLVQGISGSNFGMTATSVWAWVLAPQLTAVLSLCGSLTGQLQAAITLRRAWHWRRMLPFLAGGLLGVPLGVWLLPNMDVALFKIALGSLLVVTCPSLLLASKLPHIHRGGRVADGLSGLGGGILSGLGGYTGVVPTLWGTLRGWPKDELRALVQNFNLGIQLVTLAAYLARGLITRATLPSLALLIPMVMFSSWLGTRLYMGLSEARFRQIVLLLLTASGLALLVSGLTQWFAR